MAHYQMNFNQDFTSISVISDVAGYAVYDIKATNKMEEVYGHEQHEMIIFKRLLLTSLAAIVTRAEPQKVKLLHFKRKINICTFTFASEIRSVCVNRNRIVIRLDESLHILCIRRMNELKVFRNIPVSDLCALSFNSHLAYPTSSTRGELSIFNAITMVPGVRIRAHESKLSAMAFTTTGHMLATASEKGTVIRVFCVPNGQRVQEFRRGVKRCVTIASLVFAVNGDFVLVTSNTETVHIFKMDLKAAAATELKPSIDGKSKWEEYNAEDVLKKSLTKSAANTSSTSSGTAAKSIVASSTKAVEATPETAATNALADTNAAVATNAVVATNAAAAAVAYGGGWTDYLTKAVSSFLIPTTVSDVLSQDRSFATVMLAQAGLKHTCGLVRIEKALRLVIACEDGFLYVHDFNAERGGPCKLLQVHDLRGALEGVIELSHPDSMPDKPASPTKSANDKSWSDLVRRTAAAKLDEDNSYADILRGSEPGSNALTDSNKFRQLIDAIDMPALVFDESQFPPVANATKD